jgi:DNA polymerase
MNLNNSLILDFETTSKCDLQTHGGFVYANDPTTETLCLAVSYRKEELLLYPGDLIPNKWVQRFNDLKITCIAHNILFDYWIFNYVFFKEQKSLKNKSIKKLNLDHCYDSMASAYYYGYPGALEKVAKAIGLLELKFAAGRRAMLELSRLGKDTKNYKEKLKLCGKYCLGDIRITKKIMERLGFIDDKFELEIYKISIDMMIKGIGLDIENVQHILQAFYWFNLNADKLVLGVSGKKLKRRDLNRTEFFKNYLGSNGLNVPNIQKLTLENAVIDLGIKLKKSKSKKLKNLIDLIKLRLTLSKASVKKLTTMSGMASVDGRAYGALRYYGAHTGRYSGRGFQPHNMPRETFEDKGLKSYLSRCKVIVTKKAPAMGDLDLITEMPKTLRRLIIAPPKKTLVRADYSQIEARVIAWLAGEVALCDIFKKGEDVYCKFAERIYNKRVTKKDKKERQVGKTAVLGLGFGMGFMRFIEQLKKDDGIEIAPQESKRVVNVFRSSYPKIAGFWGVVEKLFRIAISQGKLPEKKRQEVKLSLSYAGVTLKFGWSDKVEGVYITLPAGRSLYYPYSYIHYPTLIDGVAYSYKDKMAAKNGVIYYGSDSTYGASLTENIVQAIARDIMVFAMKNIPGSIFTVHDELIFELPESKSNLKTIVKKMKTVGVGCPKWFDSDLIAVDIVKGERYGK